MKKITLLLLFLASVVIPSICLATTYSWTDVTGITGNSYTLDITGNTVTIDVYTTNGGPTAQPWYIDWIQFKITAQAITLNGPLSGPASWSFTTSANPVDLQKFGSSIPNDGFNLLYWPGIVVPGTNDNSGALLNGDHYQWVLQGVNLGGQSLLLDPTLKVGYYDDLNGGSKFVTRQMSQQVPEPTTLLLLGSGLLVLWGFKRKFRK